MWPVRAFFLTALYTLKNDKTLPKVHYSFTYNSTIFIILIFEPTVTGYYDSPNHHDGRLERVCVHHRSQSTLI